MSDSEMKRNVVIVGGGSAVGVARELSEKLNASSYNLTLIDKRPVRIHLLAGARVNVSNVDDLEIKAFLPYDKVFAKGIGQFKHGTVTAIVPAESGGEVVLESGERIPYHVLVLATGSKWDSLLNFPDEPNVILQHIKQHRDAIKNAKSIALVGGGAVGIEMAGEIKDIYPGKPVTIIQGDSALLNDTYPMKFRRALERDVIKRGVQIVLGEFVDVLPESGETTIKTRSGKNIQADLVFSTRGPKPNTEFIGTSLPGTLADNGRVKVTKTLQLPSHSDIFAIGDITDISEQKQQGKAVAHANIVSKNVVALLEGGPMLEYKGSPEMIAVTNGKNSGRAYISMMWGITLGPWMTRMMKSRTLFLPLYTAQMGY